MADRSGARPKLQPFLWPWPRSAVQQCHSPSAAAAILSAWSPQPPGGSPVRKNMAETDVNSPMLERKERGKFVSLNKKEAQLVLETYVKRSLSNKESKRTVGKKEKRHVRVQRSVSDLTKFRHRAKECQNPVISKSELKETENKDVNNAHKSTESDETVQQNQQPLNNPVKPAKKSWFRSLLDQLFKKEEQCSECSATVVTPVIPDASENLPQSTKTGSFKRNSLRRAISFKKNVPEEETKPKRPNFLPLRRINRQSISKRREKNGDCYFNRMSAEIEQLVNETDCTRKQSLSKESNNKESKGNDDLIKQIVSILQKEGDAYDRKIKEDPTLCNFFRNISYNSFKQLADVYIDKEIENRGPDDTPEDVKFAFSIHFTKQVAGISSHPVNRIMGFGNQYLQDTFTWLSKSRENLNNNVDPENCISPD